MIAVAADGGGCYIGSVEVLLKKAWDSALVLVAAEIDRTVVSAFGASDHWFLHHQHHVVMNQFFC